MHHTHAHLIHNKKNQMGANYFIKTIQFDLTHRMVRFYPMRVRAENEVNQISSQFVEDRRKQAENQEDSM